MKDWYSSIYKALIIASVISFIISIFSSGSTAYGGMLAGYSLLILGIMMILLILFNEILNFNQGSTFQIIFSILLSTGPFLLMLGVIGFIMYLIINYQEKINLGYVTKSYYTFSNISILLFLLQIYIVYKNIDTGKMSKVTSSFMYLLGVLTVMTSLIMFIILKYYTTDGFKIQLNKKNNKK
jgi:hypothetical protein